MKLSQLLASRPAILRKAALAHTAAAWSVLNRFADRIEATRLHGSVHLSEGEATGESTWPTLTSTEIRASVLEEHFTEDDVAALAEALAFATDSDEIDLAFDLESLGEVYARPLLHILEKAGVSLDLDALPNSSTYE